MLPSMAILEGTGCAVFLGLPRRALAQILGQGLVRVYALRPIRTGSVAKDKEM
jgi:hypothetical protein